MTRLRVICLTLLAAVVVLSLMAGDAAACPMCKAALGSQARDHGDWVGGFFWSILFMLSMPFIIFTSLSVMMYRLVRKARQEEAARKPARHELVAASRSAVPLRQGSDGF